MRAFNIKEDSPHPFFDFGPQFVNAFDTISKNEGSSASALYFGLFNTASVQELNALVALAVGSDERSVTFAAVA